MENYNISISQFEGPLDLLLHLVQRAEIDICDIFVSEITSQYLSYMNQLEDVDMEKASDFLTVAATLLYIKSRQLLPKPPVEENGTEEEEDPEKALIRQLKDYKAFKEAGSGLKKLFESAQNAFTRLPEDVPLPPQKIEMKDATMESLYLAFLDMLDRAEHVEEVRKSHRVKADNFTIRRQTIKIRKLLLDTEQEIRFEELFENKPQKMEVIVTFMAVLEMLTNGEIHLSQKKPFDPITLSKRELLSEDSEISYMDEIPEESI